MTEETTTKPRKPRAPKKAKAEEYLTMADLGGARHGPSTRPPSADELHWLRKKFIEDVSDAPLRVPNPDWRRKNRTSFSVTTRGAAAILGCSEEQYVEWENEENAALLPEDARRFFRTAALGL